MKKAIVLTGCWKIKKALHAMNIAKKYKESEVTIINDWFLDSNYKFEQCTENTKLIIFEDINEESYIEHFYNWIDHGIKINKKTIRPEMILLSENRVISECKKMGIAFTKRFEVISNTPIIT